METKLLLSLATRGVPGVIGLSAGLLADGVDGVMHELVDAINSARATGLVQIVLISYREDLDQGAKIVKNLQTLLDGMALDGERFTVSAPRLLDKDTARIDITRTGSGSASDAEEDLSNDLAVLDDDLKRVLTESLRDFLRRARQHSNYSTNVCGRIVKILGEKGITHVWHICEHGLRTTMGQRLIPELTDWATESLETMLKEENLSGIWRFSRSDRRQLVRRSRDYK